jgi:hypothetical protein
LTTAHTVIWACFYLGFAGFTDEPNVAETFAEMALAMLGATT